MKISHAIYPCWVLYFVMMQGHCQIFWLLMKLGLVLPEISGERNNVRPYIGALQNLTFFTGWGTEMGCQSRMKNKTK